MSNFLSKFKENFINEKDFLTYEDVAYIFNQNGGEFYIDSYQQHEAERSYRELKSLLFDFVNHKKITPVVIFDGSFEPYSEVVQFETDVNELGETITVEKNKTVYNDGLYPKTNHIILPNHYLKRLFTTDRNIQLVPFDKLRFYNSPPSEQLDQYTFRFYFYRNFLISPNSYIYFVDLLYPKEQILSLFDNKPLNNNYTELLQKIADQQATIDSQAEQIADVKAQLEQQAGNQSDTATDEKNPLKDIRTQNNLIRLLLAVNEMAKDKKGQSLDYGRKYNQDNLNLINQKLDLLGITQLGQTAYSTLTTLIREKEQSGKLK